MTDYITFPIGRMVWGNLYTPQTKDADGKPLVIKEGPDTGKPTQRYTFGVAIPKTQTAWWSEPWGQIILAVGQKGWPQMFQNPAFSWKIVDGDSMTPNKKNRKPAEQEGFKGNWVLAFSSSWAVKIFDKAGQQQLTQPDLVKCGYFIQVVGTCAPNKSTQNPGVYLNHTAVAFSAYGEEIVTGPDISSLGLGQGALPAGASATPLAGIAPGASAGMVPGATPAPAGMVPGATPAPAGMIPGATPAPAGMVPGAAQLPGAMNVPAAPAHDIVNAAVGGRQMTAKAGGVPYEQFIAQKWTDAMLIQHGYMTA